MWADEALLEVRLEVRAELTILGRPHTVLDGHGTATVHIMSTFDSWLGPGSKPDHPLHVIPILGIAQVRKHCVLGAVRTEPENKKYDERCCIAIILFSLAMYPLRRRVICGAHRL